MFRAKAVPITAKIGQHLSYQEKLTQSNHVCNYKTGIEIELQHPQVLPNG